MRDLERQRIQVAAGQPVPAEGEVELLEGKHYGNSTKVILLRAKDSGTPVGERKLGHELCYRIELTAA